MNLKRLALLVILTFMSGFFLQSSEGQEITDAAAFLKIGAGARAVALGSAFVAVADDAFAGYWNPAGLAQLQGPAISLADRVPVIETNYANIAIASPVWRLGFLGVNVIYYDSGDITMYDADGKNTGTLSDTEGAAIFSYAYNFSNLSLGVNGKYIYQDLADDNISATSSGIGADLSILYRLYRDLTVGAVFHSKYEMTRNSDDTLSGESPLGIRAGAHYRISMSNGNVLSFMADLDQKQNRPLKLHAGTELLLYNFLAFRTGLDDLYLETRETDVDYMDMVRNTFKPTFGLGIRWEMGRRGTPPHVKHSVMSFDYAISLEKLGTTHFLTLAYQF